MITSSWESTKCRTAVKNLLIKFEACSKALFNWNIYHFGNVRVKIKELENSLKLTHDAER